VEKQLLVPPAWQCASSCIAIDSWLFGQHEHNCASSATLLTWPGSRDSFLFPKLKSTLKGRQFQTIQEMTENFADGATRDPEKSVPGLFPAVATLLGAVHQCRRGVLWIRQVSLSFRHVRKKIIKNSSETFWTDHVYRK
jgi:hypothetical protein